MIEAADAFADHVVLTEREDGLPRLRILDRRGGSHHIPFPETICEAFLGPNREYRSSLVRFQYQSLGTPNSVFDYDVTSGASTLLKQTEVLGGYDPALYASERIRATAPDGTLVPLSVVYRRDRPRDGTRPLHLTGYGAYGISYPIAFSSNRLSLLDRGFACALAHILGGGDLGKPWHDAGRMAAKHNFIGKPQSEQNFSLWYTSLKNDDGLPSFRIYLQVADHDEESVRSAFLAFMENNKIELGWTGQFIEPDPRIPDSEVRISEINKTCELVLKTTRRFPESDRRQSSSFWGEIKLDTLQSSLPWWRNIVPNSSTSWQTTSPFLIELY